MSLTSRTRFVNPRLGTYFGIFAQLVTGLLLLLLIFEQLGIRSNVALGDVSSRARWSSMRRSACASRRKIRSTFSRPAGVFRRGYTGLGSRVAAWAPPFLSP